VLVFSSAGTLAQAAGFGFIEVPADSRGPALQGAVWYPCNAPVDQIQVGPFTLSGVKDGPLAGDHLPLVVISHGSGGSYLGHYDTAELLADAGFIVAAISHPGDSYQDLSRQGHLSIFASRPMDMRRLIDYMTQQWPLHAQLNPNKIGFFGFSRGGYTGLVVAGGVPDFRLGRDFYVHLHAPLCVSLYREIYNQEFPSLPDSDQRVKALVIADPLCLFFNADGLRRISVPVQLWASAFGGDGVTPQSVEAVRQNLPLSPESHVVSNAGHFAFLAPCSPALIKNVPDICLDKPDFDRMAFHRDFNAAIMVFFQRNIGSSNKLP
jgi:predicted dienelactone hydrolase